MSETLRVSRSQCIIPELSLHTYHVQRSLTRHWTLTVSHNAVQCNSYMSFRPHQWNTQVTASTTSLNARARKLAHIIRPSGTPRCEWIRPFQSIPTYQKHDMPCTVVSYLDHLTIARGFRRSTLDSLIPSHRQSKQVVDDDAYDSFRLFAHLSTRRDNPCIRQLGK